MLYKLGLVADDSFNVGLIMFLMLKEGRVLVERYIIRVFSFLFFFMAAPAAYESSWVVQNAEVISEFDKIILVL